MSKSQAFEAAVFFVSTGKAIRIATSPGEGKIRARIDVPSHRAAGRLASAIRTYWANAGVTVTGDVVAISARQAVATAERCRKAFKLDVSTGASASAMAGGAIAPGGQIVAQREVDNPHRTPATYREELAEAQRIEDDAEAERRAHAIAVSKARQRGKRLPAPPPQRLHEQRPGKIMASVNMRELVGGLARIADKTEVEIKAAEKFRGIWERAQIGGAKALDYGAVRVDTSGQTAKDVQDSGEQARAEYMAATQRLGITASALVEQLVVHDMSVSQIAQRWHGGKGGAARAKVICSVRLAINELADHFGLAGERRGGAKTTGWSDGSRAESVGTIGTNC